MVSIVGIPGRRPMAQMTFDTLDHGIGRKSTHGVALAIETRRDFVRAVEFPFPTGGLLKIQFFRKGAQVHPQRGTIRCHAHPTFVSILKFHALSLYVRQSRATSAVVN